MAKYKMCPHTEGICPCLHCKDFYYQRCGGCLDTKCEEYAVDTDKLCEVAKAYCESGRDDDVLHQKGEMI